MKFKKIVNQKNYLMKMYDRTKGIESKRKKSLN